MIKSCEYLGVHVDRHRYLGEVITNDRRGGTKAVGGNLIMHPPIEGD